jgi:uncharacterized protein
MVYPSDDALRERLTTSLAKVVGLDADQVDTDLKVLSAQQLRQLMQHWTNVERETCQSCGACCASFRVSFYWSEAQRIDESLIEKITPHLCCMRGTNSPNPRCAALRGELGGQVSCSIYEHRSSTCRSVEIGDEKCDRARARHGLPAVRRALGSMVREAELTPISR